MQGKKYWSQFWFKDYESDLALRLCSLAAQGLWMRMLCYMNESGRFGYLVFPGQKTVGEQLAMLCATPLETVNQLMQELETNGVFSREKDGTIFNRRMVRSLALSKTRAENGSKGGKKTVARRISQRHVATEVDPPNTQAKVEAKVEANIKPYILETRSYKEEERSPTENAPASAVAPDVKQVLWSEGLDILLRLTGSSTAGARTFLGKLLKELGQDYPGALAVLRAAQDERPAEPGAWIMASAKARKAGAGETAQQSPRARMMAQVEEAVDRVKKTHDDVKTIDGVGHPTNAPALLEA